jgi:aryl-alcohol dehydrogenase-like predicted oxidoreductase
MRLALGTVQFGLPYGIANQQGQVSPSEAAKILEYAWAKRVDTLDTAIGYGDSEQRLGELGVAHWRVISKLPAFPEPCADVAEWVHESVCGSLRRLRIARLGGLLLHRPHQLLGSQGPALYRALGEVRREGKVEKIGLSIYGPDELDAIWPRYQFDLVQAPFNIIDRRLAASGWLERLRLAGVEVHVRSVFLQGLLLMEAGKRPVVFNRWQALWQQWDRWLKEQEITPLQACLSFALRQPGVDRVVVGVDSLRQVQEILMSSEAQAIDPPLTLVSEVPDLVNPSRWAAL